MKGNSKLVFFASTLFQYVAFVLLNPPEADEVKRFDAFLKSPNDERLYRGLTLENELKVMLVHDPSAEKAAISLVVEVGSLNDFKDFDGLTNLAGYAITYSDELKSFLKENGCSRPQIQWTDADRQTFAFDINADQFVPALSRFSELFLKTFSSKDSLGDDLAGFVSAMHDVDREYQIRKEKDITRIEEVEKLLSKPNHKYGHFFCGNMETLGKSSLDQLAMLHRQWYSSNIMYLTIVGKEDLDTQEELIQKLFGRIPNKHVRLITYKYPEFHPWGPEQLRRKVYIVPVEGYQFLRLRFPVPDVKNQYATCPDRYVAYLLSRPGPGSLGSVLGRKNLCTGIVAHNTLAAGIGFFTIECQLTDYGVKQVDDAVDLIFQYLSLILSDGVEEYIFKDVKKMLELQFAKRSRSSVAPLKYVESLSTGLRLYPINERFLLRAVGLPETWQPTLVREFLLLLTPESMNMTIVSKSFARIARLQEKYFKTRYRIERIPNYLIDRWYASEMSDEFRVPAPNKFMPKIVTLYPPHEDEEMKHPYRIHESMTTHVWFKQVSNVHVQQTCVWFEIILPTVREDSLVRAVWLAYVACAKMEFPHQVIGAKEAGFEWEFTQSARGLIVHSSGYCDTMSYFLRVLTSYLKDVGTISRIRFELTKRSCISALESKERVSLDVHATRFSTPFFVAQEQSPQALLIACKAMQFRDLKLLTRKLYSNVSIRAFVFGNCTEKVAMDVANILEEQFTSKRPLLLQEILPPRSVQMEPGSHFIYQVLKREETADSTHLTFYQFGVEPNLSNSVTGWLLTELIGGWCSRVMRDILRVRGDCGKLEREATFGIVLMTESPMSAADADVVMESAIRYLFRILKKTTNKQFEDFKGKLMDADVDQFPKLGYRYWKEILHQSYVFDRREKRREKVHSLTLEDILNFFQEYLHASSPHRSKFTVQSYPKGTRLDVVDDIPGGAVKVEEVDVFQSSSILLANYHTNWSVIAEDYAKWTQTND